MEKKLNLKNLIKDVPEIPFEEIKKDENVTILLLEPHINKEEQIKNAQLALLDRKKLKTQERLEKKLKELEDAKRITENNLEEAKKRLIAKEERLRMEQEKLGALRARLMEMDTEEEKNKN